MPIEQGKLDLKISAAPLVCWNHLFNIENSTEWDNRIFNWSNIDLGIDVQSTVNQMKRVVLTKKFEIPHSGLDHLESKICHKYWQLQVP